MAFTAYSLVPPRFLSAGVDYGCDRVRVIRVRVRVRVIRVRVRVRVIRVRVRM